MSGPILEYTTEWSKVYDFQTLIASSFVLMAAAIALFTPRIQALISVNERRLRYRATLRHLLVLLERYRGELFRVEDAIERASRPESQRELFSNVTVINQKYIVIPFNVRVLDYTRDFIDLVPSGLLDKMFMYETVTEDMNSLGSRNGSGYVYRPVEGLGGGIGGPQFDVLMDRIETAKAATQELESAIYSQPGVKGDDA